MAGDVYIFVLITPVSSLLKVGARLCYIANPVVLLPTNLLVFFTWNYLLLFPAVTHNSVGPRRAKEENKVEDLLFNYLLHK